MTIISVLGRRALVAVVVAASVCIASYAQQQSSAPPNALQGFSKRDLEIGRFQPFVQQRPRHINVLPKSLNIMAP